MRVLLLAVLVAGCCDPTPGPTLGEAAEEVAFAQCSRWITCGSTDEQWQSCVDSLVLDFCSSHRCADPYPDYRWDNVTRCTAWYEEQACTLYVQPCGV